MQHRLFANTGRNVPVIGQGTWCIEQAPRAEVVKALRHGIALGMTHIDTAEMYGSGAAEEITAEAITGQRDRVFLVSKVLPHNASRQGTVAACEASLKRLKTDRLDCYLLHWRGRHPLAGTIEALEQLQREGKILSWGVSNFDVADLDEALRIAGPDRMVCNQVLYHVRERAIEHGVIPWCEKNKVAVVAYSPFGQGDFPANDSTLKRIAAAYDATPYQVALRYLLRDPNVFVIPKAASERHVTDNAEAGDLTLEAADIAAIDAAFPRGRVRRLPMI